MRINIASGEDFPLELNHDYTQDREVQTHDISCNGESPYFSCDKFPSRMDPINMRMIDHPDDEQPSRADHLLLLNKYQYAMFIKGVADKYKIGSFWLEDGSPYPFSPDNYWRVESIQEIHYMCECNKPNQVPKPIYCKNHKGEVKWFAGKQFSETKIRSLEF